MSRANNNNRVNIAFEDADLAEMRLEAERLDAPLSWLVRQAWQLARRQIMAEGDAVEDVRAAFGAGAPQGARPRPPQLQAAPARLPNAKTSPPPKIPAPPTPSTQERPTEPLDHQARELWPWDSDGPTI
jgi:uncharacterized small protein (TIGR04563 family)